MVRPLAPLLGLSVLVAAAACAPGSDEAATDESEIAAATFGNELPWEVISEQGETVLPDLFYAEAIQNEQIMPLGIDGHVFIDRLLYPTLGNPNLYDKSDPKDSLMVVTRFEDSLLAHLHPRAEGTEPGTRLGRVHLDESAADGVRMFLVARSARPGVTDGKAPAPQKEGVFAVRPSRILRHAVTPDMPAAFKQRSTYRFMFGKDDLAAVPAGLYDLRIEVRKGGAILESASEYQYNAVRVFDRTSDEYPVVSVTDTQVSVGAYYSTLTGTKLEEVVKYLNETTIPAMKQAPFIVFNGDLHQGGAPVGFSQGFVAPNYANEAKAVVEQLKELPLPIFLVPGNHDGYASVGHAPGVVVAADYVRGITLQSTVESSSERPWPGFSWDAYQAFLDRTAADEAYGGYAKDIFSGAFERTVGSTFASWKEVPRSERNYVLYDGAYHWQKTFGPRNFSWRFRNQRYVGIDTYRLRQHMRMSWSMYAPNYGGGMDDVEIDWLKRELARADAEKNDTILLSHHDARGGHEGGADHGYYFPLKPYDGVQQVLMDGLARIAITPALCMLPEWSLTEAQLVACRHDGHQGWMEPEARFDCAPADRGPDGCKPGTLVQSATRLLDLINGSTSTRTYLLGHVHRNSYETLRAGDELVPGKALAGAPDRELVYVELVSNASVTKATFKGNKFHGCGILYVKPGGVDGAPRINGATYLANDGGAFSVIHEATFDRTRSLLRGDPANPVTSVFN